MPKAKPVDSDFEQVVLEVCRKYAQKDLVEAIYLFNEACAKIEERFSRRAIKKCDIRPQVSLAVERLVECGRLREFSIANGFHDEIYNGFAYGLVIDREQIFDTPNLDE
jgi:hypothetical protein